MFLFCPALHLLLGLTRSVLGFFFLPRRQIPETPLHGKKISRRRPDVKPVPSPSELWRSPRKRRPPQAYSDNDDDDVVDDIDGGNGAGARHAGAAEAPPGVSVGLEEQAFPSDSALRSSPRRSPRRSPAASQDAIKATPPRNKSAKRLLDLMK